MNNAYIFLRKASILPSVEEELTVLKMSIFYKLLRYYPYGIILGSQYHLQSKLPFRHFQH